MNIAQEEKNYLRRIGEKIAARRNELGEKEYSVGKAVGLSDTVISKIEHGAYESVNIVTLRRIAAYLKTTLENLLPPPLIYDVMLRLNCAVNKTFL